MKISSCIIKSFRNLFSQEVLKVIVITALPVFLFYLGVLIVFWNPIINISGELISWIPFSILKLNGAFFILFFLWFLSVVVSFAFATAVFGPIFLNYLKSKYYYLYLIASILFFSLLYAVLFISNWDFINNEVKKLLVLLPFDTVSKGVVAIVSIYIFYNLFILTLFAILFVFAKPFLEAIKELEYGDVNIDVKEAVGFKKVLFKDILIFLGLFIFLFPLFFIPVVNIGYQLFLWTKLYHDSFLYFVCNEYCSKKEFEEMKKHKIKTVLIALIAASFNFLPIVNFFAPFFAVIMFFHCVMELKKS